MYVYIYMHDSGVELMWKIGYTVRLTPSAKGDEDMLLKLQGALRAAGATDLVRLLAPHRVRTFCSYCARPFA